MRYVERILTRADRDTPVSDQSIAAQSAALAAYGAAKDPSYAHLKDLELPVLVVNGNDDIVIPTINSYIRSSSCPTPSSSCTRTPTMVRTSRPRAVYPPHAHIPRRVSAPRVVVGDAWAILVSDCYGLPGPSAAFGLQVDQRSAERAARGADGGALHRPGGEQHPDTVRRQEQPAGPGHRQALARITQRRPR